MTAAAENAGLLEPAAIETIVLYDSRESGCRAKAFFDQLATRLHSEVQFNLALWRMDVLQVPGGFAAAFRDFGCAQLLVLALGLESVLPAPVREWIELWANCQLDDDSAVVVLQAIGEDSGTAAASLRELRQLAQKNGVNLFCEWEAGPSAASQTFVADLWQREQAVTETMQSILELDKSGPYRHWGLNE